MNRLAIVYWSGTGNTEAMAEGIAEGAREAGADYVVAMAHLGDEISCSPWTSSEVIANTTGIDALLDGHAHSLLEQEAVQNAAGEDVLALGSDYDGCDVPSWLDPCDQAGALHALIASRFGREVANKAFFGNARAFFERVEEAAA